MGRHNTPSRFRRPLTDELRKKIIKLYDEGLSYEIIRQRCRIGKDKISEVLNERGVEIRKGWEASEHTSWNAPTGFKAG